MGAHGAEVTGIADPRPGDAVVKSGRTTSFTDGHINGIDLIIWVDGRRSREIAAIGNDDGMEMGAKGDSGSVVLRDNDDGSRTAIGLIVGHNTVVSPSWLAVTPLRALLREMEARIGEELTLFE